MTTPIARTTCLIVRSMPCDCCENCVSGTHGPSQEWTSVSIRGCGVHSLLSFGTNPATSKIFQQRSPKHATRSFGTAPAARCACLRVARGDLFGFPRGAWRKPEHPKLLAETRGMSCGHAFAPHPVAKNIDVSWPLGGS